MKKNKKKIITIIAIVVFLGVFIGLSFLIDVGSGTTKQTKEQVENRNVYNWLQDTLEDEYVVTVIALTTCQYCQAYKPIITKIAEDYDLNLYFYEVDTLSESDGTILSSTYELKDYGGYVPYTFITKNGEVLGNQTGYNGEDVTMELLRDTGAIKD